MSKESVLDTFSILAEDEEIILTRIQESEFEKYKEVLCDNITFSGMKLLLQNPEYVKSLFEDLLQDEGFYCSIWRKKNKIFCGYCGVKKIGVGRPELAIELLKAMQGQGIGTRAIHLLMAVYMRENEFEYFRCRVASDNYVSQHLFEKLGAIPNGISTLFGDNKKTQKLIEDKNKHLIDEKMRRTAEKFGVEPQKLLSHILEYKLVTD